MCVPTTKAFEHGGCIGEEREEQKRQERETAAKKEVENKITKMKTQKQGGNASGKRKRQTAAQFLQPQGIKTS